MGNMPIVLIAAGVALLAAAITVGVVTRHMLVSVLVGATLLLLLIVVLSLGLARFHATSFAVVVPLDSSASCATSFAVVPPSKGDCLLRLELCAAPTPSSTGECGVIVRVTDEAGATRLDKEITVRTDSDHNNYQIGIVHVSTKSPLTVTAKTRSVSQALTARRPRIELSLNRYD
jgi:hypothetical protein